MGAGEVLVLGGRRVHVREWAGEGSAVLLLAGCGMSMEYWRGVRRRLSGRRLVGLDRPGMGGTPWPGHLPTLAQEAATLADLARRQPGPVVLVAHSMAAFHAEALARTRPDLVAGLVLVDPSVEWLAGPPGTTQPHLATWVGRVAANRFVGSLGAEAWRLGTWLQSTWELGRLGPDRVKLLYTEADALAMATAESLAYGRQAWHLVKVRRRHAWPGLPTVVLTAASGWRSAKAIADQTRLAQLLGARQVVVEGSRHLMMLDRPEVVAEAVEAVAQ